MAEMKKVPAIRFKGFSDDWSTNKVGELCDFIVPGRNKPKKFDGEIPWITTPDITNNGTIEKSKSGLAISVEEAKNVGAKIVPKDSIIMSCVGDLGLVAKVNNELIINQQLHAFIPKVKLNNWFLLYQLSIRKNYMEEVATKTAVPYMNKDNCNSIPIIYPEINEQTQIGSYFQHLDKLISLHQTKVNKLTNLKKAMLEKMFPKPGADVPEIRFKGFAGAWDEWRLGEYAKFRRGSFPQPYGKKEWYDGEGAMPFVQVVDVTNNLSLAENTKQKISLIAQPKSVYVKKGTVVVTLQGSIGRVAILQYDAFVDRTLLIFESFENKTNMHFWAYLIQKKFDIEKKIAPGGTIKTITKEALSTFEIKVPDYDEQEKIGAYFQNLDKTIALHQTELEKLNNLKKACLEKMFV